MFCRYCGKEVSEHAAICPHCGAWADKPAAMPTPMPVIRQETNVLAVVGFILSFVVAIAGLVCSILGYKKAPELNGDGKGLALAGIIISAVSMALAFILIIILFATGLWMEWGQYA